MFAVRRVARTTTTGLRCQRRALILPLDSSPISSLPDVEQYYDHRRPESPMIHRMRRRQIRAVMEDGGHYEWQRIVDYVHGMGLAKRTGMQPARIPLMSICHQYIRDKEAAGAFECIASLNNLGLAITPSMRKSIKLAFDMVLERSYQYNNHPRGHQFNDEHSVHRIRDWWLRKALLMYLISGSPPGSMRHALIHRLVELGEDYSATVVLVQGILSDPPSTVTDKPHGTPHDLQPSFDAILSSLQTLVKQARGSTFRHIAAQSISSLGNLLHMRAYPRGLNLGPLIEIFFQCRSYQDQLWLPKSTPVRSPTLRMRDIERGHQTFGAYVHGVLFSLSKRLPKSQLTVDALISLVAGLCDAHDDPLLAERAWRALLINHLHASHNLESQAWGDLTRQRRTRLEKFVEKVHSKTLTPEGRHRLERIVIRSKDIVRDVQQGDEGKEDVVGRVLGAIVHFEARNQQRKGTEGVNRKSVEPSGAC